MTEIWRGTWVVGYRELLRFVNERSRMVGSFAQPLIFLVIFGAGFGNLIGQVAPGVNFIQFMYPGIIAMGVLTTSLFAGVSVVWDREFGFLRELLWRRQADRDRVRKAWRRRGRPLRSRSCSSHRSRGWRSTSGPSRS
jgi:hypothetical protein